VASQLLAMPGALCARLHGHMGCCSLSQRPYRGWGCCGIWQGDSLEAVCARSLSGSPNSLRTQGSPLWPRRVCAVLQPGMLAGDALVPSAGPLQSGQLIGLLVMGD
jgi:hypothetical protein